MGVVNGLVREHKVVSEHMHTCPCTFKYACAGMYALYCCVNKYNDDDNPR